MGLCRREKRRYGLGDGIAILAGRGGQPVRRFKGAVPPHEHQPENVDVHLLQGVKRISIMRVLLPFAFLSNGVRFTVIPKQLRLFFPPNQPDPAHSAKAES